MGLGYGGRNGERKQISRKQERERVSEEEAIPSSGSSWILELTTSKNELRGKGILFVFRSAVLFVGLN